MQSRSVESQVVNQFDWLLVQSVKMTDILFFLNLKHDVADTVFHLKKTTVYVSLVTKK